jgi:transcriptional antiterminator RfaH
METLQFHSTNGFVENQIAWFCLRSQPKHEHLAAAQLAHESGVEVYLPRIRFRRATRQGPMWFTEALFPNYLFARFDLAASLRKVKSARGVRDVVHFGSRWPTIPESAMDELRVSISDDHVHIISDELAEGEMVHIAGGAFHGLHAVIVRAMPGRARVSVLLEFLGRQTCVELSREVVIREGDVRRLVV